MVSSYILSWLYSVLSPRQRIFLFLGIPVAGLLFSALVVMTDFFGTQASELGAVADRALIAEYDNKVVFVDLLLTEDDQRPELVTITVERVSVPVSPQNMTDALFCLHGLFVTPNPIPSLVSDFIGSVPLNRPSEPDFQVDRLCNDGPPGLMVKAVTPVAPTEPSRFIFESKRNTPRMFPFDRWTSQPVLIYPLVELSDGTMTNDIPLVIHITSALPNWEESIEVTTGPTRIPFGSAQWAATRLDLSLVRPATQKVLTVTLLLFLTGFIVGIALISDTGSVLEVSVGILLGLWGVREVLIPSYINGTTLVHVLISLLYLLLGIAAYLRFVGRPLFLQLEQNDRLRPLRQALFGQADDPDAST